MFCLSELKKKLKEDGVDGFLVTSEVNIRYVTNFTGNESILLITPGHDYLFTDFRYAEQAQQDVPWAKIVVRKVSLMKTICGRLKRLNVRRLYVESSHLTFSQYSEIKEYIKRIKLVPSKGIIEYYRKRKTQEEIEKIEKAIVVAEKAYLGIRKRIRTGVSEKYLSDILEFEIRKQGGQRSSFEIICAAGSHASQPHARATDRKIQEKESVLIDWGATFQSYNSDLTRVVFTDRISRKFEKIYQIVLDAQSFAIERVKPGVMAKEVDSAARSYIESKGYGECFGHGLGHGVGLEVHEDPVINKRSKEILEAGMVFTVEPGIYIPGWGGIRIEDIVLVTKDGCNVLSHLPKSLKDTKRNV
ncbi:MAG: Xaa-Pro peptidase family protein [Planctomycetota bacterium]